MPFTGVSNPCSNCGNKSISQIRKCSRCGCIGCQKCGQTKCPKCGRNTMQPA